MAILLGAANGVAAAPLTETGRRAYEMARAADDAAAAALDEGAKTLARTKALATGRRSGSDEAPPFIAEAEAAHQALGGYRRLAQSSVTDALRLLADVAKLPSVPTTDVVRRDALEQHALLAAHEAAVMAARARAEAERLRAVLAEARLAVEDRGAGPGTPPSARPRARGAGTTGAAGSGKPGAAPSRAGGAGGATPPAADGAETADPDVLVPNLVGARLDAAARDLAASGLRLGATTGPREGFVVKQTPEAGALVSRETAVAVTLSATAATITPPR